MEKNNRNGEAGLQDSRGKSGLSLDLEGLESEQSAVLFFEWDIVSDTVIYSEDWREWFGRGPDCAEARENPEIFHNIHPDDLPLIRALVERVERGTACSSVQMRVILKGEYVWFRLHVITLFDQNRGPVKAVGILFEIDKEMRALEQLKNRAEQDALTGLLNREETEARIKRRLQNLPGRRCALLMVDADNFKQINDSKGHMLGDVVLTEMASGMRNSVQDGGIVGRIGGDEFAVFLKDVPSREAAEQKAGELTELFRHLFEDEKQKVRVSCSMGVALYPEDGVDFQQLYQCADQALYQAKKQGKNRYVMYDRERAAPVEDTGYSTLGAAIDSEQQSVSASSDLVTLVFKILYEMKDSKRAIDIVLEIVGKRFNVSRAYIFEQSEDGKRCSNTFEWCNEGVPPEIGNLQDADSALGLYWGLFGDDSIFYCRDTGTLPKAAKDLLEGQGIYSTLQCALWEDRPDAPDGKRFSGFVGFDECTGRRLWTKEEVAALTLISEILTTFLLKLRLQERNKALILRENEVARVEAEQRRDAEQGIMDCVRFLSSSEYLEDSIDYVLRIVQEYYQSDRVYIIETDEARGVASNTYEICAPGVEPQMEALQDVSMEAISFWMEQFQTHDYIKVEDVDSLGPERRMEREVLQAQGVRSLMAVPIHVKDEMKGFLGVDDPKRHWEGIHYLMELSYFLANEIAKNALQKKR